MAKELILGIFLFIILYTIFPYFLFRGLGIGVTKKLRDSGKIAFTFDDGPNPIYTPILLDLLKKFDVKATFFVLGAKAEKYPELILRIHLEGHLIGIHNYQHRSNWLMLPWSVRRKLDKSASIVEKITGVRPVYYRPPWGLLNLFDLSTIKRYKTIFWSVMAEDWRSAGGSERVKNKLLAETKQGDIILLHDCGETLGADSDAPKNTISALKDVLEELKLRQFSCARIDEI